MNSLIGDTFLIFSAQLWRTLRSKRTLVCLALAVLPVAMALVIQAIPGDVGPRRIIMTAGQRVAWNMIIQGLVPILSLIAGVAVISEELEDRTITYLLTRPVPRAAIFLGRWLAAFVWLGLLLSVSITAVILILGVPTESGVEALSPLGFAGLLIGVALLGSAIYSAAFAALGARIKHPMIVGLGYTFAIEIFLTNLPGKARAATVQYYLRSIANEWGRTYLEILPNFRRAEFDEGSVALVKLGIALALALGLGVWILSRRQYVLSS